MTAEERRARNALYQRRWQARQKRHPNIPVCSFCRMRRATSKVERLIPLPTGFYPVIVAYCGKC